MQYDVFNFAIVQKLEFNKLMGHYRESQFSYQTFSFLQRVFLFSIK